MMCKEEPKYRLGFPVQGQATVYNISYEPVGTLDGPWLFKAEDLYQPCQLILLSPLGRFESYWGEHAYVEKKAITLIPPPELHVAEKTEKKKV